MRRIAAVVFAFVLAIASIYAPPVQAQGSWCAEFNLFFDDYNFDFTQGVWTGAEGIKPVGVFNDWNLVAEYLHSQSVTPSSVDLVIASIYGDPIVLTGTIEAFGFSRTFSSENIGTVAPISLSSDAGSGSSIEFNLEDSSVLGFGVRSIRVYGTGDSPFEEQPIGSETPFFDCSIPPNETSDWCYRFDFREDEPFAVVNGSWADGQGYISDNNDLLILSYDAGFSASPLSAGFRVKRVDSGNISIAVAGEVLGLDVAANETIPASLQNENWTVDAESAGITGSTINISLQSSGTFALWELEITGSNLNPFGNSNCGRQQTPMPGTPVPSPTPIPTSAPTATPEPSDTPEPTETELPTETALPTETPTPTTTTTPVFCSSFTIDFESAGGYSIIFGAVESQSGSMVARGSVRPAPENSRRVNALFDIPVGATVSRIDFDYVTTTTGALYLTTGALEFGTIVRSQGISGSASIRHQSWTGLSYTSPSENAFIIANHNGANQPSSNAWIDNVVVYYCIPNPPTRTPSPTRTASSTRTPTISRTPTNTRTPNPGGPTFTPRPGGGIVPTATRTFLPFFPPPSLTPVPPSNTPIPPTQTYTPGGPTITPSYTPEPIVPTDTGTPGGFTPTIMPLPSQTLVPAEYDDIGDLAGGVLTTIQNMFNVGRGWVESVTGTAVGIYTAWYEAPASAPPGMPLCKSQPLLNEYCAILYIIRWTILSGTVGALIIPLATIVLDLFIVLVFIRIGRAVIARLAKVTEVS